MIAILLFYAITLKLSCLLFAGTTFLVLLAFYRKESFRMVKFMLPIGCLIFIPFAVRGWVLSGYVFFPMASTAIGNPDWKVPTEQLEQERRSIEYSAKYWPGDWNVPTEHVTIAEWFPNWYEKTGTSTLLPILLSVVAVLVMLAFRRYYSKLILIFAVLLATISLFLIIKVPDLRFIYAQPWLVVAFCVGGLGNIVLEKHRLWVSYGLLAIQSVAFVIQSIDSGKRYQWSLLQTNDPRLIPTKQIKLVDNTKVYVVTEGDQCWNNPIPCIPPYDQRMIETRNGTISSGFRAVTK
jgi:hypothetical protein